MCYVVFQNVGLKFILKIVEAFFMFLLVVFVNVSNIQSCMLRGTLQELCICRWYLLCKFFLLLVSFVEKIDSSLFRAKFSFEFVISLAG